MRTTSFFVALALSFVATTLNASDWSDGSDYQHYYQSLPTPVAQVTPFTVPALSVSITDFGAKGDGATLCTEAIQRAIDDVSSKGGGHVNIPEGVWLTAPIELRSNIDLHLDKNAILLLTPDKSLHLSAPGKSSRCKPGIGANKCKNISITGGGVINGNGQYWRPVKRSKMSDVEWKEYKRMGGSVTDDGQLWYPWDMANGSPNIADTREKQENMRQDLVRLTNCENILVKGVTIENSPRFHLHPCNSRNIIIDGVTVRSEWNVQNGDGIDLSDCSQCLVVNSTVSVGDDGICMKSSAERANAVNNGTSDILIDNCTVNHAHGGFVVGSNTVTAIRNIVVRHCRFIDTDTGLRFKSGIGNGGRTENIHISHIVMANIKSEAIIFQCDYANMQAGSNAEAVKKEQEAKIKAGERIPEFQDIHIDNVTCTGCQTGIRANGITGTNAIHNIDINNSTITYHGKATDIDATTASLKQNNVRLVSSKNAK